MILGMVCSYSSPFLFRHKFYAPTAGVSSLTDGFSLGGREKGEQSILWPSVQGIYGG